MAFQLLPYDPAWPQAFEALRCELATAFGALAPRIEHIGSTAVPGLCSKPVVDVLVGADSLAGIEAAIPRLEGAGFAYVSKYEAELPMRRYFVRPAAALPRVHVHAVCTGSPIWQAHLAFRDALRRDARCRDDYAALKQRLARQHGDDKAAYGEAKAPFIRALLATLAAPPAGPAR